MERREGGEEGGRLLKDGLGMSVGSDSSVSLQIASSTPSFALETSERSPQPFFFLMQSPWLPSLRTSLVVSAARCQPQESHLGNGGADTTTQFALATVATAPMQPCKRQYGKSGTEYLLPVP